ncbi:hypothetical protein BLNAU_18827 [Blattamonas nauphoetae]|uniref:Uncharacterized protein n=1 Tax=Blattamonas nauphoetae TaxID=2049346 RepID=A0ABQ9X7A1_9EUKA|nr:hypothetical protein BLNAU_18827 [Blattamonas nauphoetae]
MPEKSAIYNSLVALVKAEYQFGETLQDRAARFLQNIEPMWFQATYADQLVTELVPSSDGSPSGFIESIVTLLSSPHSTVIGAALSFINKTLYFLSKEIRYRLAESDLITNVLAIVQPHKLPISGNETIIVSLLAIIFNFFNLATSPSVRNFSTTAAIDAFNHYEMIFQNVVIPSSQFLTFLISNRVIISGELLNSFMLLLFTLLRFCPYHRPTLEFVLASPIVLAFSSGLRFVENDDALWNILFTFDQSLLEWKTEGPEVAQSGKRMRQALFSEGFDDTLEGLLFLEENTNHLSRMTPTYFCELSSDVGNAMIADADEQILGSPPTVQK